MTKLLIDVLHPLFLSPGGSCQVNQLYYFWTSRCFKIVQKWVCGEVL